MDITTILAKKFPGSNWYTNAPGYAGLHWLEKTPQPTEQELTALWPTVEYEVAWESVEQARKQAYTETSDPLYFEWQRGDATEQEWRDAVQAVKDAHPYPTPPGE